MTINGNGEYGLLKVTYCLFNHNLVRVTEYEAKNINEVYSSTSNICV